MHVYCFFKWHTPTCCVGSVANGDSVSSLTCKKRALCAQNSVPQSAVLNLCTPSDTFACASIFWTFSTKLLQLDGVYILAVLCSIGKLSNSLAFAFVEIVSCAFSSIVTKAQLIRLCWKKAIVSTACVWVLRNCTFVEMLNCPDARSAQCHQAS